MRKGCSTKMFNLDDVIKSGLEIKAANELIERKKQENERINSREVYERTVQYCISKFEKDDYLKNLIRDSVASGYKFADVDGGHAAAEAIKKICPSLMTSVESNETDYGDGNYVTNNYVRITWR